MHGEEESGSVCGGVEMKIFHCLTREEGKMGDCQARPVRPVALKVREKNPIQTLRVNFQSIRENIQRIRDFDHKEVLE